MVDTQYQAKKVPNSTRKLRRNREKLILKRFKSLFHDVKRKNESVAVTLQPIKRGFSTAPIRFIGLIELIRLIGDVMLLYPMSPMSPIGTRARLRKAKGPIRFTVPAL